MLSKSEFIAVVLSFFHTMEALGLANKGYRLNSRNARKDLELAYTEYVAITIEKWPVVE